jgi:alkylhydroperoxidase family enzyme
VPGRQLEAICDAVALETLPARERAIVAWVDQITVDARAVTDELVSSTLDHLRDDQLVELTVLAGAITLLNQYGTAFDIPPPPPPAAPGGHRVDRTTTGEAGSA